MGNFGFVSSIHVNDFPPRGENHGPRLQEVLLHPWLCPLTKVKVSPFKDGGTFLSDWFQGIKYYEMSYPIKCIMSYQDQILVYITRIMCVVLIKSYGSSYGRIVSNNLYGSND